MSLTHSTGYFKISSTPVIKDQLAGLQHGHLLISVLNFCGKVWNEKHLRKQVSEGWNCAEITKPNFVTDWKGKVGNPDTIMFLRKHEFAIFDYYVEPSSKDG